MNSYEAFRARFVVGTRFTITVNLTFMPVVEAVVTEVRPDSLRSQPTDPHLLQAAVTKDPNALLEWWDWPPESEIEMLDKDACRFTNNMHETMPFDFTYDYRLAAQSEEQTAAHALAAEPILA